MSRAFLGHKMPTGVVIGYGAPIERGLKFIRVEFNFKTELGNIKFAHYVEEKDVTLIKKKIKSK